MSDMTITQQELYDIVDNFAKCEGTNLQSAFRDMLTDARHVAAIMGVDFEAAVDGSACVYAEEVLLEDKS